MKEDHFQLTLHFFLTPSLTSSDTAAGATAYAVSAAAAAHAAHAGEKER